MRSVLDMSRIGNSPIIIPNGVSIDIKDPLVKISGINDTLEFDLPPGIKITISDTTLTVFRAKDDALHRSMHGTVRQILNNMIIGVSEGFTIELEIRGVGYQAQVQGSRLLLQLGFSHDIYFDLPQGIKASANRTEIKLEGADKQLLGSVAAKIRSFRPPEPYKGKGVRYKSEHVRTKQGKTVGAK